MVCFLLQSVFTLDICDSLTVLGRPGFSDLVSTDLPVCFGFTCYQFDTGRYTHSDAQQRCQDLGMHTFSLSSLDQMQFLSDYIVDTYGELIYINIIVHHA